MSPLENDRSVVLFDLDGTLADTTELILTCYRHALAQHRGSAPPDEVWLSTMGTPLVTQMRAFTDDEEEVAALVAAYVSYQREVHDDFVTAFPGARETALRILELGAQLAIVTSKRREMALRTLACCGLDDLFPVLVTPDETENYKPHPEPVLRALSELGQPPGDHVLFVGDSPYDIEAGRNAGVRTAGVLWGPHGREGLEPYGPDYVVETFDELVELI
jgi:pyrophosphatase PpaX